jgi:DNA-binding XRE family transcriptional regulator
MNQTEFADLFDLKRTALGSYEEGRAEAKIETLIKIAEYFNISLDQLLRKEITVNEIFHFEHEFSEKQNPEIPLIQSDKFEDYLKNPHTFERAKNIFRFSAPVFENSSCASVYLPFNCPRLSLKRFDLLFLSDYSEDSEMLAGLYNDKLSIVRFTEKQHTAYTEKGSLSQFDLSKLTHRKTVKQYLSNV